MIAFLASGTTMSATATVTPERVAQWKPAAFRLSSVAATMTFG